MESQRKVSITSACDRWAVTSFLLEMAGCDFRDPAAWRGGWGGWASLVSTPPSSHWCDAKVNSRTQARAPQVSFYLQLAIRRPEVAVCLLCCQSYLPRGGDALATILTRPSLRPWLSLPPHRLGTNSRLHHHLFAPGMYARRHHGGTRACPLIPRAPI